MGNQFYSLVSAMTSGETEVVMNTKDTEVDRFLMDPIPKNNLSCKQDEYRRGCKLLYTLDPNMNEYKWVEAKIRRILQAIDK